MSEVIRVSKHDLDLLTKYKEYRIKKLEETNLPPSIKNTTIKQIEKESISEQIHFIITQICLDKEIYSN